MGKTKVVFLDLDTIGDVSLTKIQDLCELTTYGLSDFDQIAERIANSEIVITNKCVLNSKTLSKAKNLKLICIAATGMDNVDLDFCKKKDILVKNIKSYSTASVCQYTFNLFCHAFYSNDYYFSYVKNKQWSESNIFTHLDKSFHEWQTLTWGIVGLGEIGQSMAKLVAGLGFTTLASSMSGNSKSDYAKLLSLEELFKQSDIISLHCRLDKNTESMVNKKLLVQTENQPILINVARGAVVNEKDIVTAIEDGLLSSYISDVSKNEPIAADHPFLASKYSNKIFLSPHIAWSAVEARNRLIKGIEKHIKDYIKCC